MFFFLQEIQFVLNMFTFRSLLHNSFRGLIPRSIFRFNFFITIFHFYIKSKEPRNFQDSEAQHCAIKCRRLRFGDKSLKVARKSGGNSFITMEFWPTLFVCLVHSSNQGNKNHKIARLSAFFQRFLYINLWLSYQAHLLGRFERFF